MLGGSGDDRLVGQGPGNTIHGGGGRDLAFTAGDGNVVGRETAFA